MVLYMGDRIVFNFSVLGASHIEANMVCQDFSASLDDGKIRAALVADGHGGKNYIRSDTGSELVVKAALSCITQFVNDINPEELQKNPDEKLKHLCGSIIYHWNEAIQKHYAENPLTPEELGILDDKYRGLYLKDSRIEKAYGTTLIAAAITDRYWFGLQIGDGTCVVKSYEGNFFEPIPPDERCFLNQTPSISSSDALDSFHFYFSQELPAAVFIASDGVDDCYANRDLLNNFYDVVLKAIFLEGNEKGLKKLEDYLPVMSKNSSKDDMSVAGIIDMSRLDEYVSGVAKDPPEDGVKKAEELKTANSDESTGGSNIPQEDQPAVEESQLPYVIPVIETSDAVQPDSTEQLQEAVELESTPDLARQEDTADCVSQWENGAAHEKPEELSFPAPEISVEDTEIGDVQKQDVPPKDFLQSRSGTYVNIKNLTLFQRIKFVISGDVDENTTQNKGREEK